MDAIEFEVLYKGLISIAEEMGVILQKSSYSPNIRERMDASCAIFSNDKKMMIQAEHIPVHLGSMHLPLKYIDFELYDGDQIIINDPNMGGTHLPDITIYKPVFYKNEIVAYVASRAHHADIGGISPGSMPGNSTDIFQEGFIIPPVKILIKNNVNQNVIDLIKANTRTPKERIGDIMAQVGSNNYGSKNILQFIDKYGIKKYKTLENEIFNYTKRIVKKRMKILPKGKFTGFDFMELQDNEVKINVDVKINEKINVDFKGTSQACNENINAPLSVTLSAVYFFFRTILGGDFPSNSAFYDFINISTPKNSIVNAPRGAAVVGGNVETSQRIVDAMLNAFSNKLDVPAQSHGTMNNISFGNNRYTYYETIGGGSGGANLHNGTNGVHVYMTNTKNTPIEVIESSFPLLCMEYHLRVDSGGMGMWKGGEGMCKHYKALEKCTFSIISDRRKFPPKGIKGGSDGAVGENIIIKNGIVKKIDGKCTISLEKGDEVIIKTPGGGGYGKKK